MLLKIYNKLEPTLARGGGVHLYDDEDRESLDFASGIGVRVLGYNYRFFNEASKKQIGQILHTSNLYHNKEVQKAARNLAKASKLHHVFFTNSGTESVEGAMKVAKKYAFNRSIKNPSFIAFKNSFHGRALGALSLTANGKYKKPFKLLINGIRFAAFNDLESVKKLLNERTCAIVLESVQGGGGINPTTPEFYKGLRKLCDERDPLLTSDEIQRRMGRSGKYFAYGYSRVVFDVAVFAKALDCGVAVRAFDVSERVTQNSLKAGDHGSTYGGNPFVCAAVNAIFKIYAKEKILSRAVELTPYLEKALDELTSELDFCEERRGLGLIQGLRLNAKIKVVDMLKKCRENHLLLLSCSKDDLRFLPPLVIEKKHIDVMAEKLRAVLRGF